MNYLSAIFLSFSMTAALAQSNVQSIKQDLAFYGDVLMNAAATPHRLRANENLLSGVRSFLQIEDSYHVGLEDVPWISTVQADSSDFRILTWQVNIDDSIYYYEGYIQMADGRFFQLKDDKSTVEVTYRTVDTAHWYGARYTKIHPFVKEGRQLYLLFGFNANDAWNRQKVVDVFYMENGMPKFGFPVFTQEGKPADRYGASRLLVTYSSETRVTLDYDNQLNMIVHDHLMPIRSRFPGQGETFVGDGTFVGYKMNAKGEWIYQDHLYESTSDEPLDDGLDRTNEKKKDLFGREKQR